MRMPAMSIAARRMGSSAGASDSVGLLRTYGSPSSNRLKGGIGGNPRRPKASYSGGYPLVATARNCSPSKRHQRAKWRVAKCVRLFQHGVENRGEVAGRGVYDAKYLSGRGLLIQRLSRFGQ